MSDWRDNMDSFAEAVQKQQMASVSRVNPDEGSGSPKGDDQKSSDNKDKESKGSDEANDSSDLSSETQRSAKPLSDSESDDDEDKDDKNSEAENEEGEESEDGDDSEGGDLDGLKNIAKGAASAASGAQATSMAMAALLFQKFMMMMLAMMQAVVAAVSSAIAAIVAVVVNVVVAVATAIGVGVLVATFGIFAAITVAVVAIVVTVSSVETASEVARLDDMVAPCEVDVTKYNGIGSEMDVSEVQLKQAESIYSVMTTYGLNKYHVAGMLGNFQSESGIDSTSIEGIYDEPYRIGPRKSAAQADFNAYYTLNGFTGSGYKAEGGNYGGIGLGQWTAGRHLALRRFADSVNLNWYEIEAQLMYMISPSGEASYIAPFAAIDYTNSDEASDWWLEKWEVPADIPGNRPIRRQQSKEWLVRINEMVVDKSYADSIIALADAVVLSGADNAANRALQDCVQSRNYDNSSIALAASSYAHPSADAAKDNNGTELYQTVVKGVTGQSGLFQSCDVNVTSAVRWSGTDDDYPLWLGSSGASGTQAYYLRNSEKWEKVNWNDNPENLQPGDIFNASGEHTVVYVGHEAVVRFHPEYVDKPEYVVVGASHPGYASDGSTNTFGGRSAGVEQLGSSEYYGGNRGYEVFRNVKSDKSLKYRHIGSGTNPSDTEVGDGD